MDEITIELSKKKMLIYFLCSIVFVIIGILLIFNPNNFITPISNKVPVIELIGSIGVLVFGFTAILLLKKILDKKFGLIISNKGIYDNSSSSSVGLIEWDDIIGIDILDQNSDRGIVLRVDNEQKYLSRIKSPIIRYNMKASIKWYKSPLIITSVNLKIDDDKLLKVIVNGFEKFKNK
jgi:hypothetical protein